MPGQHLSRSGVRDALLAVMVATLAFALGTVASGLEIAGMSIPVSGAVGGNSGPVLDLGTNPQSRAPIAPARTVATRGGSGFAPVAVPAPTRALSIPAERIMGEGGGRDHFATSDPLGHRTYLLDTAALMHRRGWMDRDGRVARPAASGFDKPSPPAAKHGSE